MNFNRVAFVLISFAAGSVFSSLHGCSPSNSSGTAHADDSADASLPTGCPPPDLSPTVLATYDEMVAALKAGSRVRVILDYAQCTIDGHAGVAAVGGLNFDTFEIFGPGLAGNTRPFVGASESKLIKFENGFVYDYVRVNVNEDNTVEALVQYLKPSTFEVTVDETFACSLSKGATVFKLR